MDLPERIKRCREACDAFKEYYNEARGPDHKDPPAKKEISLGNHARAKMQELGPCMKYAPLDVRDAMEEISAHWDGDRAHWMNEASKTLEKWIAAGCAECGHQGAMSPKLLSSGLFCDANQNDLMTALCDTGFLTREYLITELRNHFRDSEKSKEMSAQELIFKYCNAFGKRGVSDALCYWSTAVDEAIQKNDQDKLKLVPKHWQKIITAAGAAGIPLYNELIEDVRKALQDQTPNKQGHRDIPSDWTIAPTGPLMKIIFPTQAKNKKGNNFIKWYKEAIRSRSWLIEAPNRRTAIDPFCQKYTDNKPEIDAIAE